MDRPDPRLGALVILITDLFQPLDRFAIERFLNGDVSHCCRRRRAMPMLLVGRKPDDIARPDFLNRAALSLRPAATSRDDQGLPERVRVPGGPCTRLEGDACSSDTRW